jgi:hypothetical protein
VLEVPDVTVKLSNNRRVWTYGTVGVGVNYGPTIWKDHIQVFTSHTQQITHLVPSNAVDLGRPNRLKADFLNQHPVECLLIEGESSDRWIPWIGEADEANRPTAILSFVDKKLLDLEDGPIPKNQRKALQSLGYDVRYWYLQAWEFGAALDLSTVGMVWFRTKDQTAELPIPRSSALPVRPMSNLLKPFGIPSKAWSRRAPQPLRAATTHGPCRLHGQINGELVYDELGAMPNIIGSWISTAKGTRRLQYEELAKAKGINDLVTNCDETKMRATIRDSTGIHLWSASLDALAEWLRGPEEDDQTTSTLEDEDSPQWDEAPEDDADEEWTWEPPNLQENHPWYQDRVESLKVAVEGMPEAAKLFNEGIRALERHRTNYSDEGPKCLQLLWWEFPAEHWEDLREGSSMNFLIEPTGQLVLNAEMDDVELSAAGKFVDQLMALGVLQPAEGKLLANCPLFCVDKPGQAGEKRCIADMKSGGQNSCIGKDPVYLTQKRSILAMMYANGWSAVADASKQFHNFATKPHERKYLGCIHPISGQHLVYCGLPMGSASSPAISCRITNGGMRTIRDREPVFQGKIHINTWATAMADGSYDPRKGHGRVLIGEDGLPAALIWVMVDDYFIHAPTKRKCQEAFSVFMNNMVRLGFICQCVKTSPPAQRQKFCGMIFDTTKIPTLLIPSAKISRARATITRIRDLNSRGNLTRLSASVLGGLLQSLVDATPSRQGQTYLRSLYDNIHHTSELYGRKLYYTTFQLAEPTIQDLHWWDEFLILNPGQTSRAGHMRTMGVTWGDGSGTGTGGTFEEVQHTAEPTIDTWMGTWAPHVSSFDSNWRELRTLLWTMERLNRKAHPTQDSGRTSFLAKSPRPAKGSVEGGTLFYFTDNMVTYYIVHNGSSTSPSLHNLIRRIKILELRLRCRLEPIHVPGRLMILQGADGLSRGIWMSADHVLRSSVEESRLTLSALPFNPILGAWALRQAGFPPSVPYNHITELEDWSWNRIGNHVTIWNPAPELTHQALTTFLDLWVEKSSTTAAIFMIPRILQRDWGFLSKHVIELGVFDPRDLPWGCRSHSLIPFCLLFVPYYVRSLPAPDRMDLRPYPTKLERWCADQATDVRGL